MMLTICFAIHRFEGCTTDSPDVLYQKPSQSQKDDVELPLPFCALLDDLMQREDLLYASLSFLEPCPFSSQLVADCVSCSLDP